MGASESTRTPSQARSAHMLGFAQSAIVLTQEIERRDSLGPYDAAIKSHLDKVLEHLVAAKDLLRRQVGQ
jgi:hypothetical protein